MLHRNKRVVLFTILVWVSSLMVALANPGTGTGPIGGG
jgi:hypothetical protein